MIVRLAALFSCVFALPVFAADGIGGSLDITSDYVFRGISQSNEQPALQGDVHYASSRGWSAGLWASTIQFNWWDGRTAEVDGYLSYRWPITIDWSTRVTGVHYAYPWNTGPNYEYNEAIGSVAYRDNVFFTVAWAFDAARYSQATGMSRHSDALSYEAAVAIPLRYAFVGNVGIGHYAFQEITGGGYTYWNAGLGYDWRSWHADITYIGTSANAKQWFGGNLAGNRITATLLWRF